MDQICVMVIDDDSDDRSFLIEAFNRLGQEASFIECTTGQQALHHLSALEKEAYPHLIFLDLHMPGKGGCQILTEIKSNPSWATIPVMVISSSMLEKDIDCCTAAGCALFFTKPMSLEVYDHTAANALRYLAAA